MKPILLSTILAMGVATVAFAGNPAPAAQDDFEVEPSATASGWSGFYAGGLVSFDGGDSINNITTTLVPLADSTGFGAFVGYNKQVNALVFGGELAYITGDVAIAGSPNSFYRDRIDLKARLGYSFGRVMPYGVLGYSFTDFDDLGTLLPSKGVSYGVGVDVMVNDRLFVGAEYLMRDLSGNIGLAVIDSNINSASVRVGLKF